MDCIVELAILAQQLNNSVNSAYYSSSVYNRSKSEKLTFEKLFCRHLTPTSYKDHEKDCLFTMRDPHRLSVSSSVSNTSFDTLPRPVTSKTCMSAAVKRWRYLRRLLHYKQMDFEFAFWQMVYLLSNPKVVYKNFTYRKKTKAQFARDDPAFLVLLAGWLVVSSAGFAVVLGIGFVSFVKFLLYVIFVDCIGVGLVIATMLWFVSNKFLLKNANNVDIDVEWGYCFDVHLK